MKILLNWSTSQNDVFSDSVDRRVFGGLLTSVRLVELTTAHSLMVSLRWTEKGLRVVMILPPGLESSAVQRMSERERKEYIGAFLSSWFSALLGPRSQFPMEVEHLSESSTARKFSLLGKQRA